MRKILNNNHTLNLAIAIRRGILTSETHVPAVSVSSNTDQSDDSKEEDEISHGTLNPIKWQS